MGYKKLSDEQEKQLVQEYVLGIPVKELMTKYNFASKKSIIDKVKKHCGENYKDLINSARYDVGLDLTDEDCIAFLSEGIGKNYTKIEATKENRKTRYRLILTEKELVSNLKRYGVVQNKSLSLTGPNLLPEEEKFIPYLIRGIIDGDGTVSPTSYGAPQFAIYTASEKFADWLVYILENKMYMTDIHKNFQENKYNGLWRVGTANHNNILKLITLSYDKPFGMARKYKEIRKTFNDYNSSSFI